MKHLVLGLALGLGSTVAMAEVAVPEKAAACAACHGEGGAKPIMATYPVLAGQYANYLEHSLFEYQNGQRTNPVMVAQAAALSKEDIRALSRYFAAQSGPLYTPAIQAAQTASGN